LKQVAFRVALFALCRTFLLMLSVLLKSFFGHRLLGLRLWIIRTIERRAFFFCPIFPGSGAPVSPRTDPASLDSNEGPLSCCVSRTTSFALGRNDHAFYRSRASLPNLLEVISLPAERYPFQPLGEHPRMTTDPISSPPIKL